MMVKVSRPFIKATCVRGVPKPEKLEIKLVAKLMAKRAQECTKRGNLLPDSRPHPDTSDVLPRVVISKELGTPSTLMNAERPRRQHSYGGAGNPVKIGGQAQKFPTRAGHSCPLFQKHGLFNAFCQCKQAAVLG